MNRLPRVLRLLSKKAHLYPQDVSFIYTNDLVAGMRCPDLLKVLKTSGIDILRNIIQSSVNYRRDQSNFLKTEGIYTPEDIVLFDHRYISQTFRRERKPVSFSRSRVDANSFYWLWLSNETTLTKRILIKRRLMDAMSNESPEQSSDVINIKLKSETVVTDEKIIKNLERVIKHLREGNVYTTEDKEVLFYQSEEYVTGERKKLDPEFLKYLFTGWFIHTNCDRTKQ